MVLDGLRWQTILAVAMAMAALRPAADALSTGPAVRAGGPAAAPPPPQRAADNSGGAARHGYPKKWVAQLFFDALWDFTVAPDLGSSACQKQTQLYTRHLENDSNWAVQMSDSWSRYPNGLLVGATHHMGVYEECVDVHQPIQGKYCVPSITLKTTTGEDYTIGKPVEPPTYGHAWREIIGFVDRDYQAYRNNIKMGVCIPEACSAQDLETSLQRKFDEHFLPHEVKATVEVESILCSTGKDMYPYDTGYYITSVLVGSLVLICCLSTAYHLICIIRNNSDKKPNQVPEILSFFSIIHNGRILIKYKSNNNLNVFNGIKVTTMIVVLFGHKFLYFIINPLMYSKEIEKIHSEGPDILLTCSNLIDPFFYIAGYLMYVMLIPQFSKPKTNWIQIPLVILYKYLKVIPPYAMMMLLTAFIIPHMGDGPFWASRMWIEADKCKNYWWANFLAVSNFIDVDNQCLIVGWYISCLLQFLAIGTIVVYMRVKNRKLGIYTIILLFLSSMAIPFYLTYVNKAYGIVRVMYSFMLNPSNSFEFSNLYRPFYLRGTPFYAGLLAGVAVEELKRREIKFSMMYSYVATLVVVLVCSWVQLYGAHFYEIDRPYNVLEQSVYAVVSHCTWSTILFCITVCHFISGYGPLEKLFNNRIMVPLGRLSYTVYLVNITTMMMIESRQRAAVSPSFKVLTDGWIVGSFRTYYAGILLHILVEAPMGHLIKKILQPKSNSNHLSPDTNNALEPTQTEQKQLTHL